MLLFISIPYYSFGQVQPTSLLTEYIKTGKEFLSKNEYNKAILNFKKVVQINPNEVQAYLFLGFSYESLNQFKDAEINFEIAKNLFQKQGNSLDVQRTEQMLKELPQISFNQNAIQINANDEKAYVNLGEAYILSYQYQKAVLYFKKAIQLDHKDINSYLGLGMADISLKNFKEAGYFFQQAIQLNSQNIIAYSGLGISYDGLHQYKKAILCFEKIKQINPNFGMAYNLLGLTYKFLNQSERAKTNFEKAKELFKNQGDLIDSQKVEQLIKVSGF